MADMTLAKKSQTETAQSKQEQEPVATLDAAAVSARFPFFDLGKIMSNYSEFGNGGHFVNSTLAPPLKP